MEGDFPEIFFNVQTVKKYKFGLQYKENLSIEKIIEEAEFHMPKIIKYYKRIKQNYGTFDGINFTCKIIANDFLKKY
jgi:hypothetical protein